MSKREKSIDYAAALTASFDRWDYLNEHGGSDPFWADGVNMNLVRNHIIYYKNKLETEDTLFGLPDCFYRETPPEVDNNYIACPDEIRENAVKSMQLIDSDENLKYVREQAKYQSDKVLKSLCIPAIIGYSDNLRTAIANDDLLTMRRYRTVSHYLEAFESAARKLNSPEILEKAERRIVLDDVDDEEICEEYEEQPQADVEKDETPAQNEVIQLTFF